jgi:xanthine dehydrogenase YagR molybdenum-binding subunit
MRAPGEAPGLMALESPWTRWQKSSAWIPIEFRIRNDTQVDPESRKRPFSQRSLVECLQTGRRALRLGQALRRARHRRDGKWLVGMGVASASAAPRHEVGRRRAPRCATASSRSNPT